MAKKTLVPILMFGCIILAVFLVGGYFLATWLDTTYAVPIELSVFIVIAVGIFTGVSIPLLQAFKR